MTTKLPNEPAPLAVVAVGGNSIIKDPNFPDLPHQWEAVRECAGYIASLIAAGWRVVVTHGNGPQVGFLLRKNELAAKEVHTAPLDIISANAIGGIGYMLQQALSNELHQRALARPCVTLLTQTLVAQDDPAFDNPSKPIGSFMDEASAQRFAAEGWRVMEDAGRGWRRLVASPQPLVIIEETAIRQGLALGWVVIAVGGGGIPVVRKADGELRGVYAVVDKDLASSLLATRLQADLLLISTGVEQVALHFGQPSQRNLATITLAEARQYLAEGHFGTGSMLPKMEAAVRFVADSTQPNAYALITSPEHLLDALAGTTGTRIVK